MRRTHSAWIRKSCSCQSATQVVLRIAILAWKKWASEAENGLYLSARNVHGQQFSREPQIDNAPVRQGKALANMPMLHPALKLPYKPCPHFLLMTVLFFLCRLLWHRVL